MAKDNDVTTKFKVDISDLKKNISEANRQIKLANATFKAETGGMDDWSKSADGISAKLKQLDSVMDAQKSKLESYREQYERTNAAYEENAKRADELREKLRALAEQGISENSKEYQEYVKALQETEKEQETNRVSAENLRISMLNQEGAVKGVQSEIDGYAAQLAEMENSSETAAEGTDELGRKIEETADNAEDAGDGFSVLKGALADLIANAVSAAIDALKDMAAAAYDAWEAYDSGADIITKATGATGEAAKELTQSYENLSRTVKGSFDDIGTAIGEVNTRFGLTGEELEDLSGKFLKFAELNGTDVKNSVDNVQAVMAAFGMETEEAGAFLDTLNKAAQDTGVSTDTLLSSLKSNSAIFDELGYSISDSVMMLANFEKSGVDSSAALTGLKKAMQNAMKDGVPLSDAMESITDSIRNAETETEAMSAAAELFGAKTAPAMAKAIRDGRLSFDEMGTSIKDFEGNIDTTYENILDANDMLDLAVQNVKVDAAAMFDEFLNGHTDDIKAFSDSIQGGIIPAFKNLIAGAEGAEEEAGEAIGRLTGDAVSALAGGLPDFIRSGAEIATSIAKGLLNALPQLVRTIGKALPEILKGIKGILTDIVSAVVEIVPELIDALLECVPQLIDGAVEFLMAIVDAIPQILPKIADAIPQIIMTVSDTLTQSIPKLIDGAVTLFTALVEAIPQVLPIYAEYIPDLVTAIAEMLIDNIPVMLKGAVKLFTTLVDAIPEVTVKLADQLADIVNTILTKLAAPVEKIIGGTWEEFTNIWGEAIKWVEDEIITPVKDSISGMWGKLLEGAGEAWENIKEVFSTVAEFFGNIFGGAWEKVKEVFSAGGMIFKGIGDGILEAFKGIVNSLIEGINKVVSIPFEHINSLLNDIRDTDILGFKPFETLWSENPLKVPQIPMLEKGGILKKGQIGLLEGTGAEAVVPLEKNMQWINAVAEAMRDNINTSPIDGANLKTLVYMERMRGLMSDMDKKLETLEKAVNGISSTGNAQTSLLGAISGNTEAMRNMNVNIDGKTLVGKLAPDIDKVMGRIARGSVRGG